MATLGIMSAMKEEIESLLEALSDKKEHSIGMRAYHEGKLFGVPCVLVFSRWGKVAASSTATTLATRFKASRILFTGVAGSATPSVRIGDVVIANSLIQHDVDARPLFERHEIPLLSKTVFETDAEMSATLSQSTRDFFKDSFQKQIPTELARQFRIDAPELHTGLIASGDHFFSTRQSLALLKERLPQVLCVEMEGAAVAQVCHEYGVPFSVIRTISDSGDESASHDFPLFVKKVASHYSFSIIQNYLETAET